MPRWTTVLLLLGWCAVLVSAALAVIDLERARTRAAAFQSADRQLTAMTDSLDAVLAAGEEALDPVATRRAREILDSALVLRRQMGDGPDLQAAETARTGLLVAAGMMTVAVAFYFLALLTARREKRRLGPS